MTILCDTTILRDTLPPCSIRRETQTRRVCAHAAATRIVWVHATATRSQLSTNASFHHHTLPLHSAHIQITVKVSSFLDSETRRQQAAVKGTSLDLSCFFNNTFTCLVSLTTIACTTKPRVFVFFVDCVKHHCKPEVVSRHTRRRCLSSEVD